MILAIGAYQLVGVHFWKAFLRGQQHYTLTSQRAFIGTALLGRKSLKAYPITRTTNIELEVAGSTGDIYFATSETRRDDDITITKIGFEQIEDPRHVWLLIRQLQEADA